VKCDERKPECAKCTDAGMKCDGYPSLTKSSDGKQQRQHGPSPACNAPAPRATPHLDITAYAIPFQIPGSQKDRQLLHYYCVHACHDLSGYLSSDFWSRLVLQTSHSEPVVRHALVALSSVHLGYAAQEPPGVQQSGEGGQNVEAFAQYNRAVRQLRKYLSTNAQPSIGVALICCALFYCFESTRGDFDAAREHLRSGLVILKSAKAGKADGKLSSDSLDLDGELEHLTQIFSRLDLQATMFDETRTPFLELTSAEERCGTTPTIPNTIFNNLEEARVKQDKLQNQLFNFLTRNNPYKFVLGTDLPDFIIQEKHEMQKQCRRWSVALEAFLKLPVESVAVEPESDMKLQRGATALKLHHRVAEMFLSASFPEDSTIFGASPNSDAEFILELAESLVQNSQKSSSNVASGSLTPARSFSSEMGIVAPLFLLAMKCHDPHIGKKATSLLAMSNRREGLIDAKMVLGILERVAMLKRQEEITPLVAEAVKRSMASSAEEMPLEVWGAEAIEGTTDGLQGIAKMLSVTY
jgi:hypothetical protein